MTFSYSNPNRFKTALELKEWPKKINKCLPRSSGVRESGGPAVSDSWIRSPVLRCIETGRAVGAGEDRGQ
jgi:hypothetical protein